LETGAIDRKKILVLIADDEVNLLTLLKDNLEEQGFRVSAAVDGEDALEKCMKEKPDVVVLDVEMPKLNGWRVCQEIRRNTDTSRMPVILMLSAYAQPEDIKKGLGLGAKKYMTKPFKMQELVETILALYLQKQEKP